MTLQRITILTRTSVPDGLATASGRRHTPMATGLKLVTILGNPDYPALSSQPGLVADKELTNRKQFSIPGAHRRELESQVNEWLKMGLIQPCRFSYNSPLFIAPKKDGSLIVIQDFIELNAKSMDDSYSMKDVNECIGDIGRAGSSIFSTQDLTSGFWQMPLNKQYQNLTFFTFQGLGKFEWIVSPMGLLGCPVSFQRLEQLAMRGLINVNIYKDNLLHH
jgi:hypothetical protein